MRLFQFLNLTKVDRRVQSNGIYYSSTEAPGREEDPLKGSQQIPHWFHCPKTCHVNHRQRQKRVTQRSGALDSRNLPQNCAQIVAPHTAAVTLLELDSTQVKYRGNRMKMNGLNTRGERAVPVGIWAVGSQRGRQALAPSH